MNATKKVVLGSICVAIGQILFGAMEVVVKFTRCKLLQIFVGRYLTQFILAYLCWQYLRHQNRKFRKHNWYGNTHLHYIWLRGFCHTIHLITLWYSLRILPIGDVQCFYYTTTLCVIFGGYLWLKETLPARGILIPSTLLILAGIWILSQPSYLRQYNDMTQDTNSNMHGIISMLICVASRTLSVLMIKKAKDAHWLQLEFAVSMTGTFIAAPIIFFVNTYVTHIGFIAGTDVSDGSLERKDILVIFLVGICGFIGLQFKTWGYQYSNIATVAWLEYINIPIGYLYQIFIFQEMPNRNHIIGASMVTVACLMPSIHRIYLYFTTDSSYVKYETVRSNSFEYFELDKITEEADEDLTSSRSSDHAIKEL